MKNAPFNTRTRRATFPLALTSAIAMALTGTTLAQSNGVGNGAGERHGRPFDRTIVAASPGSMLLEAQATEEGGSSEPVELLRTTFDVRPQDAEDLVIRFDGECATLLDEDPEPDEEANPEQQAPEGTVVTGASVRAWVEVDGSPVPVSPGGGAPIVEDDGSVVLCRAGGSLDFEATEPDAIVAEFESGLSPNGFTWVASDVGRGTHEVVVKSRIDLNVEESGEDGENGGEEEADAMALIGQRMLNVELAQAIVEEQATDMKSSR